MAKCSYTVCDRGTVELEHHFQVLASDVQLCVVDDVIVALHPGPDGALCLLFDVDSPSADRALSPVCVPAVLHGLHVEEVRINLLGPFDASSGRPSTEAGHASSPNLLLV